MTIIDNTPRMNPRTLVGLRSLVAERERQDQLKAEGRFRFTCADPWLTPCEKYAVLGEEMGEVAREALAGDTRHLVQDGVGTDAALYRELTQVAAVALAWMESLMIEDDDQAVEPETGPQP